MRSVWKNFPVSRSLLLVTAFTCVATLLFFDTPLGSTVTTSVAAPRAAAMAPSVAFPADVGSLGAIPDGPGPTTCGTNSGANKDITFTVSGLSGTVETVSVSNLTFSPAHTWRGDLTVRLIAPNGANFLLFGWTGSTTAAGCGSGNDIAGPYAFGDTAASNWWTTTGTPTPTGNYRTSTQGGVAGGGALTLMNPAFTGVTNANGTWTLRINDWGVGDTGSVSAATLNITTGGVVVPADANVDINGDGKTDYVVARGTAVPLTEATAPGEMLAGRNFDSSEVKGRRRTAGDSAIAPPIYWYTQINGSAVTGVGQLGDAATDFITPEDFDGDGKDDLAVWTEAPATQANFKILQSTTNTVRVEFFGQTGDDPAVVGDYDGDNKADPAVYRCPGIGTGDGQCYFFYRGSNANPGGNVTYVPWGFGEDGDFFPYVGDLDGDGKHDFCIQRANPASPTNGQFVLLKSTGGIEYINWGLSSDFLIPGDYDGDGKTDLMVRRTVSGSRHNWLLTRTGATSLTIWGVTGDASTPGDYDGDGKTDLAIWRGNTDPAQNYFWVLNSSNGSIGTFEWGQCATVSTCDFAVAGWAVH